MRGVVRRVGAWLCMKGCVVWGLWYEEWESLGRSYLICVAPTIDLRRRVEDAPYTRQPFLSDLCDAVHHGVVHGSSVATHP